MSKDKKLLNRFLTKPKNFKWNDLVTLLRGFGYQTAKSKKTGGSRVRFVHEHLPPIMMHRPHPSSILKRYQLEQIKHFLKEEGLI